ncbi:MAG TPA: aminotransferase class IV [Bdellovibrionota bacterium]|jgi:branched-chain amino acid aminotransferase
MRATANVNGTITPAQDARVSIFDRGFQYGDSVYEVTRTYEGVPFFLEEHFDRLENSARLARMKITQARQFLTDEIRRTVKESGAKKGEDVFIRYTVSRGTGPLDLDPATAPQTTYVILVKEIPPWKPEFYSVGTVLAVPETVRNSPRALDPNIKSGNYLNNILAVAEAKELGGDDALMLSIDGKLTEASNSNVAFLIDGQIRTPKHEPRTNTGNLRGLTRTLVGQLAEKAGLGYSEAPLFPADVEKATECFVSSATREVMPVKAVLLPGGKQVGFPPGGGSATKRIRDEYAKYVRRYIDERRNEAWF